MPPRYISRLRLSAFRNYASAALDLDGRHLVLTGPNGAGKTNLLEAVSLLSPGRGLRRAAFDTLGIRATCLEVGDERDVRWVWRLRRLLAERHFDIVHAHSPYAASFARWPAPAAASGPRGAAAGI